VTAAGKAYCWGSNLIGKLGAGTIGDSNVPVAVADGHLFASVTAGADHTCGVTTAGSAWCWGFNINGQLGTGGSGDDYFVPVAVSGDHAFASVSTGDYHTCGVTTAGAAYCWGSNDPGALGDGTNH
jgi:alpha-tubulin suppressor-like RCC1 family protein